MPLEKELPESMLDVSQAVPAQDEYGNRFFKNWTFHFQENDFRNISMHHRSHVDISSLTYIDENAWPGLFDFMNSIVSKASKTQSETCKLKLLTSLLIFIRDALNRFASKGVVDSRW